MPENGQNMPQIIRYSFVHRSSQQCTVFPWKNHPIVKQGLKRKLRTIGDPRGSLGGPSLPEKSKKMLQIIKYSFVHLSSEEKLSIPIVKSSHSRIFYLDFSWHTSWSIKNRWGSLWGPSVPENGKQNASNYQLRPSALQKAADKCHRWWKNRISAKMRT